MEQLDELLVRVPIENQLAAIRVQPDLEHPVRLAAETRIGERIAVRVELRHLRPP